MIQDSIINNAKIQVGVSLLMKSTVKLYFETKLLLHDVSVRTFNELRIYGFKIIIIFSSNYLLMAF